jgi:hypothetical protein
MTYRNVLTVSAIFSFLYGIGLMLIPAQLVTIYNLQTNDVGAFIANLYGATLFGFGLVNWLLRDSTDPGTQRAVLTADFVTAALATIFSLMGQLGGVQGVNALGWSTVVLYLIFALAFGYLRFVRRP